MNVLLFFKCYKFYFFFIIWIFFFSINFTLNTKNKVSDDVVKAKVVVIEEKKVLDKRRKVNISVLREDLISQLIILLKLVEEKLNKLLIDTKKEFFYDKSKEVMNIFCWINKLIEQFNEDPCSCCRDEIELYLSQAQKYKLFLNSI